MLRQWLAQILLGAINIEQSKLLNTAHISLMLGGGLYKDLRNQRIMLGEIATDEVTRTVLRTNARQVGIQDQSDLYLDPHTKHYTGEKNVLKGWCSGIGCVDKVMHSDFIHSVQGHPVYFETTDNFLDLRERTFDLLDRFRAELEIAPDKVLTAVIDRGIFGAEIFAQFAEHPQRHLITSSPGKKTTIATAGTKVDPPTANSSTNAHATTAKTYSLITSAIKTTSGRKTHGLNASSFERPIPKARPSKSPSCATTSSAPAKKSSCSSSAVGSKRTTSNTSTNTSESTRSPAIKPSPIAS